MLVEFCPRDHATPCIEIVFAFECSFLIICNLVAYLDLFSASSLLNSTYFKIQLCFNVTFEKET